MSPETTPTDATSETLQEQPAPACVMSFNASDPSGAGGVAGDVATIAAMGAHGLPIVTSIVMRDTAEVFDQHVIDADVVVEQARSILEDVTIAAWKVGFLGSAEGVSAVAEILSDYPDVPLVSYLPNLSWVEEDAQQAYLEAFRELVLPQTEVLVGSHQTLTDFLLPDWDSERPASPRELAVAASEHGTRFVLVTSVVLPNTKGPDQFLDNVLRTGGGRVRARHALRARHQRRAAQHQGAGPVSRQRARLGARRHHRREVRALRRRLRRRGRHAVGSAGCIAGVRR